MVFKSRSTSYFPTRVATVVFLCALGAAMFTGCGLSGGGGGGSDTTNDTNTSATIGAVQGYVFVSSGAGISPTRAAGTRVVGARAADTGEVRLGRTGRTPSGFSPAEGVTVGIVGTSHSAVTGTDGSFSLSGVRAGRWKLSVLTSGTAPVEFPLTVIGNATIKVGEPGFTRSAAEQAVLDEVASFEDSTNVAILSPRQPLPTGTVVEPALGNDEGDRDASLAITLASEKWFFFVDPSPSSRWQHGAKYYFVGADSGEITVYDRTSWPLINGLGYYGNRETNCASTDATVVPQFVDFSRPQAIEPLLQSIKQRDHTVGVTNPTLRAFLICGADESGMKADLARVKEIFNHGGMPPAVVYEYQAPTATPLADLRAKWNRICQETERGDYLLILISSHAWLNGIAYLERTPLEDGTEQTDEKLRPSLFTFSNCRACHIIFWIDACYSGSWVDPIVLQFTPPTEKKVTIMTASDSTHESVGINWYDPRGRTGGIFTTQFILAFQELEAANPGQTVSLLDAFKAARTTVNGTWIPLKVSDMNPQYRFIWNGQPCGAETVPVEIGLSPSSISATHKVGVTPVPQTVGTFTLTNQSTVAVNYTATSSDTSIIVTPQNGTLAVGGSVVLTAVFNGTKYPPVSSTVSVTATATGGGTKTVTGQVNVTSSEM